MPRNRLNLVMAFGGGWVLLFPQLKAADAQEFHGGSRAMQVAQEGSQRRSRQRGGERPAERAAPQAPAEKVLPPASVTAPGEPAGRTSAPAPEAAKALTWPAQDLLEAQAVCLKALAPIRASIDVSEPLRSGDCGTLGSVTVRSVGGVDPVGMSPASPLTCPMVVALHDWVENGLQPIARAILGVPVAALTGVATYQCRDRVGGAVGLRSEHSLANAIDITAFVTTDGRTVDVKSHWGQAVRDGAPPATPTPAAASPDPKAKARGKGSSGPKLDVAAEDAEAFLKAVHRAACRHFTTVLGPEANDAHRDHFHFDLAQRRSGYRLCQ